jgi:hypothetical protein
MDVVHILAQNNFGDTRTGGLAGPMGLLIVLLLAIATVLLVRNMNARLRRLPERFPHETPERLPRETPESDRAGTQRDEG